MSLLDRLPSTLPVLRDDSNIGALILTIQSEFEQFQSETDAVQNSLFLPTASGQSLDLIGVEFGLTGRRANRSDAAYREFLQGLVPIFNGRGTEKDVEVAVAAGVANNPTDVDLDQDFQNRTYQVELLDFEPHQSGTTRDLAELADPPAVDRVEPVQLLSEPTTVAVATTDTQVGIETILTPIDVFVSETDTDSELRAVGLSAEKLEPLSTSGFRLSEQTI
jgi:hypothetical protein